MGLNESFEEACRVYIGLCVSRSYRASCAIKQKGLALLTEGSGDLNGEGGFYASEMAKTLNAKPVSLLTLRNQKLHISSTSALRYHTQPHQKIVNLVSPKPYKPMKMP